MVGSLAHRWSRRFRRELLTAAKTCVSHKDSNVFGLLKLGLQYLAKTEYYIVSLDKEPGFVFIDFPMVVKLEHLALSDIFYKPTSLSYLNFA